MLFEKGEARYSGKLFQQNGRQSKEPREKIEARYGGKLFNQDD